eukprot:scaffold884_cov161-Isochrysis_galbana.AAC.2
MDTSLSLSVGSILMATASPSAMRVARYTRPYDPRPISHPSAYSRRAASSIAEASMGNPNRVLNGPVYLVHGLRGREAGGAVSPPV